MPTRYVKLGNRTLDQWKVTELREELKKRKLSTSGLKTDLVKRLDEAVRSEMGSSMDNAEDDASESEESNEEANPGTIVSDRSENIKDGDIEIVEKLESKIGDAVDDSTDASGEGKVIEADLVEGTKATGLEQDQVPEPSIVEITEDNDTIEPVKPLSEPDSQNHGTNEDGDPQEDAKLESAHLGTQSPQISESSTPVVPDNAQDLHGSGTQNEAIHSTEPRENDGLKEHQPDQPVTHQVSDVDPNLGFQVTSDSVCTESVSIFEKNELKIDVIDDNVKLELDVKPEMQQSPSGAVPEAGESHPMDVGEPHETIVIKDDVDEKDSEEPHDDENLQVENTHDSVVEKVDCFKSTDSGDLGPPEKLSLDRSSGDDSMEEDVMESKLMDDKSDSFTENVEKSGTHSEKEEDHVDVVGHDMPVEMVQHAEVNITNVESDTVSTLTSGKRKFLDKGADGSNDVVKKVRSWNSEGVKISQPQSGSLTPKGLSEPTSKPIPGTNSMAGIEAPKESVVPPSPRAPTNSLRIDRFLRPFTLKAAQQLLGKTGTVTGFWMDHIKTHCYVSYSSVDEAEKTRNAVYNLQWPPNGGRLLVAEFVDPQEVKSRVEAPLASPATPSTTPTPTQTASAAQPSPRQQVLKQQIPPTLPPPTLSNPPHVRERLQPPREQQPIPSRDRLNLPLPPPPPLPEKNEPPILTLDDLFRKTKATPRIYYLPLSDELVAAKLKTQGKTVTQ